MLLASLFSSSDQKGWASNPRVEYSTQYPRLLLLLPWYLPKVYSNYHGTLLLPWYLPKVSSNYHGTLLSPWYTSQNYPDSWKKIWIRVLTSNQVTMAYSGCNPTTVAILLVCTIPTSSISNVQYYINMWWLQSPQKILRNSKRIRRSKTYHLVYIGAGHVVQWCPVCGSHG